MKRFAARACLLSVCVVVACNGELTVLSEPVDVNTQSSSVTPASCPELAVGPSNIAKPFAQLIECGECRCEAGQAVCEPEECAPYETMPRCPEHSETWPEAETARGHIQDDTLYLDAKGYGGCGDVDLLPCYVRPQLATVASQSSYPKKATIRVLNVTPYQDCPSVVFQRLQIGLRTLAEFRSEEGGLVDTNYGLAQVGELSCDEAARFAEDQILRGLQPLEPYAPSFVSCESDADCSPGFAVSCGNCVNLTSNRSMLAAFESELQRIDTEVCAPLAGVCREQFDVSRPGGAGCGDRSAICRNGSCVQVSP